MIRQSVIAKVRSKFNVSIAEVEENDTHQILVLGIACVAGTPALADNILDKIADFIEANTDAEMLDYHRELR